MRDFLVAAVCMHSEPGEVEKSLERMALVELKAEVLQETRRHRMKYFIPRRRPELYKDLVF